MRCESVYCWVEAKGLPAHKVGSPLRFKQSEINEWVCAGSGEDDGAQERMSMAKKTSSRNTQRSGGASSAAVYSTRILKATALLSDTRILLEHWDGSMPVKENLARFQSENIFGKTSRSRVQDILKIFRQRYLQNPHVIRALNVLAKSRFAESSLNRILYYHSALSDRLIYDVVTDVLLPQRNSGIVEVSLLRIQQKLRTWIAEGKTASAWSDSTIERVTQNLAATLRDFGVLEGAFNKRIAVAYLPIEAFAYICFYIKQNQPSGHKLIQHPDWQLFFMQTEGVERSLAEAHQRRLLEWHAAGSVTRLTFPAANLEEYARVLVERTY